ncbi:hypothetical protein UT300012_22180 [Paraclostridium bifermentans]
MYKDSIFLDELKSGIETLARSLGKSELELVEEGITMLERKKKRRRRMGKDIVQ